MPKHSYIVVYDEEGKITGKISTDVLHQNNLPNFEQPMANLPKQYSEQQAQQQPIIVFTQIPSFNPNQYPHQQNNPYIPPKQDKTDNYVYLELVKFFIALLKFMVVFTFIVVSFLWLYFVILK